jgi:hypothetical protein
MITVFENQKLFTLKSQKLVTFHESEEKLIQNREMTAIYKSRVSIDI